MIERPWIEEDPLNAILARKRIQYREQTFRHHSSKLEMQLLRYVATGDVEAMAKHINDPLDGERGLTSQSPLRDMKNFFVGGVTAVVDLV